MHSVTTQSVLLLKIFCDMCRNVFTFGTLLLDTSSTVVVVVVLVFTTINNVTIIVQF